MATLSSLLRTRWDHLAVLLVAVGVFAGWSAAPAISPSSPELLLGRDLPVDGAHTVFIYAALARGLSGEGPLTQIDGFWFPVGRPLLDAAWNMVDALLAAPLLLLLGPARGTMLATGLFGVANALAGGFMGRRLGGPGWPAVVGAVGLGFAPFAWAEIHQGRPTQALLAPLALALAAAVSPRGRGIAAGLLTALSGACYWFHGLFLAPLVGLALLGSRSLRQGLGSVLVAGLACLLAISPFALWVFSRWGALQGTGGARAFRVPVAWPWQPGIVDGPSSELYLPLGLCVLAVPAVVVGSRRLAVPLLLGVLALFSLSFGSSAVIFGRELAMPWSWLDELPLLSRLWWPYRALGAASVGLAAVAALGAATRPGRWLAPLCLLGVFAQVLDQPGRLPVSAVPPLPGWHAELPPGPILLLPALDPRTGKVALLQQADHGRPLVNGMGMSERDLWPPEFSAWWKADPLLRGIEAVERGRKLSAPADARGLARAGVVAVLIDEGYARGLPAESWAWLRASLGEPRCGLAGVCAWVLNPEAE